MQEEDEEEFTCSKDHAGVDPFIAKTPSLFWVKVFIICSPSSLVRIGLLITVQNLPFVIHHILYNPCSLFSLRIVCTGQNQELGVRLVEHFCSHESETGFHFCLHRVTFQILGTKSRSYVLISFDTNQNQSSIPQLGPCLLVSLITIGALQVHNTDQKQELQPAGASC